MSDLINRQDVIDILEIHMNERRGDYFVPFYNAIEEVNHLPSAEPERKTGKWIMIDDHTARCSICNERRWTNGHDLTMKGHIFYGIYKYCPECGAEMRNIDKINK